MSKITFFSFFCRLLIFVVLPTQVLRSQKNPSGEFELVYQSGNPQNGYAYSVYEKIYYSKFDKKSYYSYKMIEGKYENGEGKGFGKVLEINLDQKLDFEKRDFDSAKATYEITVLPKYYTKSGKEEDALTLKSYKYFIGSFSGGYLRKGIIYESYEGKRYEGIFAANGDFDYGSFTMRYKDTLLKGFISVSETSPLSYPKYRTTLHSFIADSSLIMIPYYCGKRLTDLNTFPQSAYNTNKKPVVNMRYKNGVYNGEAYNGKPEGLGEWISDDAEFVEYGYFKNGEPHGLFCKNFHEVDPETGKYRYSEYPVKELVKGCAIGIFTNGKPSKIYVEYKGFLYEGEVDEKFIPNGYGTLTNRFSDAVEEGNFISRKLDGYGTRLYRDKRKETGTFSYGVLTSGVTQLSVRSLSVNSIVKKNGKRLMVMEKIWDSDGGAYVKLSDGSILTQGDRFEMDYGGDSDFYTTCTACNGSGYLLQTVTNKFWSGNDTKTHRKVERIAGQDYIITSVEMVPKYIEQTTTQKNTCMACGGKGRRLNR